MGTCCSQKKPQPRPVAKAKPAEESPNDPLNALLAGLYPPNSNLQAALVALKDHLDSHHEDIKRCFSALQRKAKNTLNFQPWTDANVPVLEAIVKAGQTLLSLGPLHVIAIMFDIAGQCVTKPAFLQLRSSIYTTLEGSSYEEFEEIGVLSGSFLTGLMQFCRQAPDQVIARDIAQLSQLVTSSSNSMSMETHSQKWEELLVLLMDRLKEDVKGTDLQLVEEEKRLFGCLCKEIACTEKHTQDLCSKMIRVIDECQGWGTYSAASLEVLLEAVAKYQSRYCSQLFRLLLACLPARISKGKSEEAKTIIGHIVVFLKTTKEQIATLTYTPTLLSVFLALFAAEDLHESANRLLTFWSRRTDIQSCIRLLGELSLQHRTESNARFCLSRLKKCIRPRILKDWHTHIFCENWNQLLADTINKSIRENSLLTLHVADFVISVLGTEASVRVNDAVLLSKAALACLQTLNGEMNATWLKACKYSSQIWQNLASQKTNVLRNGLLKIVGKLQGLADQTDCIPVQASLMVMLLVLAHNIGKYYEVPNMLQFAVESGNGLAPLGLYPRLFEMNMWEELYDSPSFLFHKADLSGFLALTSRIYISPAPLRLPMFDSSLSREGTFALLKDNLDPMEALQSEGSFSDISPLNTGDVKVGFQEASRDKVEEGQVKAETGTTGEEMVVRQN